jgi:putative transposase
MTAEARLEDLRLWRFRAALPRSALARTEPGLVFAVHPPSQAGGGQAGAEGARAAYSAELGDHRATAPGENHGKYPWEVVHIDHTLVDLELLDEETHTALGRPLVDSDVGWFSRQVLAFVLTFDAPSVNSLRLLLRDCVRRHRVCRAGWSSIGARSSVPASLRRSLRCYGIQILKRPPHRARFGSVIEREFGTLNEAFFHNLSGNTQNTRNVRQLTKSMDPKRYAAWTLGRLGELAGSVCRRGSPAPTAPRTWDQPRQGYQRGMEIHGSRPSRLVDDEEAFRS